MISDRLLGKELCLIDIFGRRRVIAYGVMLRMTPHRATLFFILIVAATLTLSDPNSYREHLSIWQLGIVWLVAVLVVTGAYVGLIMLWAYINLRTGWRVVFFPLIAFLSTFPTLFSAELTYSLLSGQEFSALLALNRVLYVFLIIEVFDILHFSFAMPVIIAEVGSSMKPAASPTIKLAGQKFSASSLCWAMSQDHYLKIFAGGKTHMLLARMSDLTGQIDPDQGIQPHRSWWISAHAAGDIQRDGKAEVIEMQDGTRVPLARGRAAGVRAWLAARNPPESVEDSITV